MQSEMRLNHALLVSLSIQEEKKEKNCFTKFL